MRRLSFILILAIMVGGVSLWSAQASAAPQQTVHSSVLLAQAVAQPSSGFFSGIASAIDRFVDSVVKAVTSVFRGSAAPKVEKRPIVSSKSITPVVPRPTKTVTPLSGAVPTPAPAQIVKTSDRPVAPMQTPEEAELSGEPMPVMPSSGKTPEAAKNKFSLFPAAATPKLGLATKSTAVKPAAVTKAIKATETPAARSPAKDTLKYADVDVAKTTASTAMSPSARTSLPSAAVAPSTMVEQSAREVTQSAPVARPTTASRADSSSESRAAALIAPSQPLLYSQPYVALPETPAVRAAAPVATRPVAPAVRQPVVAEQRFIDTYIPRPVVAVERPVTVAPERTDTTTVATRDSTIPEERPIVAVREPAPVDRTSTTTETRATEVERTPPVEPVTDLRARTIILSDGRQQMVIQEGTIIDPATIEAVVCNTTGDFPILSLGEDDVGVTRAVVLASGTIALKPTDIFKKFVRSEGTPFAMDTPAKDCTFSGFLMRQSTPELIISMPKLSENDRELISGKTVVGTAGRVSIVATDNSAEKILRGIVVRDVGATAADSKTIFKTFPPRSQVAQSVRSMTVSGDLARLIVADLVFSDGITHHCEFTADTDMTCTIPPAVQR